MLLFHTPWKMFSGVLKKQHWSQIGLGDFHDMKHYKKSVIKISVLYFTFNRGRVKESTRLASVFSSYLKH